MTKASTLLKRMIPISESLGIKKSTPAVNESSFVDNVYKKVVAFIADNKDDIEEWCRENDYNYYTPEESLDTVKNTIKDLERKGYSEEDAYNTIKNIEDIDPRISESRALANMKKIADKYK